MKKVVIRLEAGPEIGVGHVMRGLALAEELRFRGVDVMFVTHSPGSSAVDVIEKDGFLVYRILRKYSLQIDVANLASLAKDGFVILDGKFGDKYQKDLADKNVKFMIIDDCCYYKHYYANIVVNQNMSADKLVYNCRNGAKMLFGPKYAMIRHQFIGSPRSREFPDIAKNVLITMGGSDPGGYTQKILGVLCEQNPDKRFNVIIGSDNKWTGFLKEYAVYTNVYYKYASEDMPSFMNWADIAVSSAGITTWELAYMGTPSILVITTENQEFTVSGSIFGVVHSEEIYSLLPRMFSDVANSRETRKRMHVEYKGLVDGLGCCRIADEISALMGW